MSVRLSILSKWLKLLEHKRRFILYLKIKLRLASPIEIVNYQLETEGGRADLARAMVEPIRRQLEYQSLGRRLLMVEPLPEGAYARINQSVTDDTVGLYGQGLISRNEMMRRLGIIPYNRTVANVSKMLQIVIDLF